MSGSSTPLPLAPDRAALSNRINLLLSSQASVLQRMNLQRPTNAPRRAPRAEDDEEDWTKGTRPNEGVGFVREPSAASQGANRREERMLRGKNGAKDQGRKKMVVESESDEEVGRSALGKRKRERVRKPELEVEKPVEVETEEVEAALETEDQQNKHGKPESEPGEQPKEPDAERKKRRKKRKPKKKPNQTATGA